MMVRTVSYFMGENCREFVVRFTELYQTFVDVNVPSRY